MDVWSLRRHRTDPARPRSRYALARKYSFFSVLLLSYVALIFLLYDLWSHNFHPVKASAVALSGLLAAAAIAKFTSRVIGRPLAYLQEGMKAVSDGRLDVIQVSRTGDEIEYLGESFNAMIRALNKSQSEVRQYQESLEERIRERTADLEAATKRALAASQAKSEFLANVSHELRTPMSGVLGMLDMVMDGKLEDESREQLQTAKGCALSLLALLNGILDLSKIESGKMTLEEIPFDPRAVTRECVDAVRVRALSKQLTVRCRVASGIPKLISGDPLRFRQILTNLVSNAVKFTERGLIEVRLGAEENERSLLAVEVADTGIGIPANKLSAIFEEFTQADGSISRKYGGTGLGLAITRRLVNMHGGEICVQSEPGRGSLFRVLLPMRPVCQVPAFDQDPASNTEAPAVESTDPDQRIILVAEDNAVNQKVVTAMLKRHGYRVELAHHGGEVIDALERVQSVSLILMDVQMPVIDGVQATRLVRAHPHWCTIPIIAMTAHAMTGDREACLKQGMDDYVSKPLNRQQLIPIIEKHIRPLVSSRAGSLDPE